MKHLFSLPLLMAGATFTNAQEDIYELVTTAIHTRNSETALPVTVLTGDKLHNAARATIGDTLSNQPGINNASFGPAVGQTVIRGHQGRRVLNMTNGIPNADVSGSSADHAVTVEPILANSIEVLRGPSTLLYGGGAIGGVVNVIDNRIPRFIPDQPSFALEIRHDNAADLNTVVTRAEFATGNLVWHLDALRREWNDLKIPGMAINSAYLDEALDEVISTEKFIANTEGETASATFGFSYIFNNGYVGLAANRIENTYGLPNGAQENEEENILIDMNRTRYDLIGEWRGANPLIENLDYRLSFTKYEHAELEGLDIIGTRFNNDSWQQRLQITHTEFYGLHGVLGFQASNERFAAVGEESFIPITEITSQGIFLVEDFHIDAFTFEIGARVNRDKLEPQNLSAPNQSFSTKSYSASGLWDISGLVSLGLSFSHSERAPSVEEIYSNFGINGFGDCVIHFATSSCEIGSTNFVKEASNNIDFTVYLDYGNFNATITLFNNEFDNYIFQSNTGLEKDEFPVRLYQQVDASFSGFEVESNFSLNDLLELRIFSDKILGSLDKNGDVPRLPPMRIGSQLTFSGEQWSTFISVLHAGDQNNPGINEIATEGYTRWDIGADYTFNTGNRGEFLFFAKGRNLSDDEIRLSTSFLRGFAPEAGRSLEIGIRYQF